MMLQWSKYRKADGKTLNPFVRNCDGSVLVEFAIVANLLIVMNILTFDFASYYRLSEQIKHGTQIIQTNLANDADRVVMTSDLHAQVGYLNAVTGLMDFSADGALVVMDVMPIYRSGSSAWALLVCWSWSSNPASKTPPARGTILSSSDYPADPWAPTSGAVSASSALVIVEASQSTNRLFGASLIPATITQKYIGPVRYFTNQKINLNLYDFSGGASLNDASVKEPPPSNAIACQR